MGGGWSAVLAAEVLARPYPWPRQSIADMLVIRIEMTFDVDVTRSRSRECGCSRLLLPPMQAIEPAVVGSILCTEDMARTGCCGRRGERAGCSDLLRSSGGGSIAGTCAQPTQVGCRRRRRGFHGQRERSRFDGEAVEAMARGLCWSATSSSDASSSP